MSEEKEPPSYHIENAKSGRAACKKCKDKIAKGDQRIGVTVINGEYAMISWYHPKCYNLTRKMLKDGVDATRFVTEMLEDNTDEKVLRDTEEEMIEAIEFKPAKVKTKRAAKEEVEEGEDEKKPKRKKAKKGKKDPDESEEEEEGSSEPLSDSDRALLEIYEKYVKFKVDELKDVLSWNHQPVSGVKETLLTKIMDGHMHGRLGLCPTCSKGRLKLGDDGETVVCRGWYDETAMFRHTCYFSCPRLEATRLTPWFTEKPTEEEEEQINAELDTPNASSKNNDAIARLKSLASALPWKLKTPTQIKSAASDMLRICTDDDDCQLDLPGDSKAKREIGKLVLENKSKSPPEIVDLLIERFGFTKAKTAQNKQKADSIANICTVSENGPVMEAMMELSEFYFKEGNSNAGNTYRKVANAIKGFEFEITEENAKGLGKNKTKVAGIGKGSADKMYEFVTTGTMEKLEEKRASAK